MAKKFVWGSVDHQKELFTALGYDWSKYDPNNQEEVSKMAKIAMQAQFDAKDASGKMLSPDDLSMLASITGRG